MKPDTPILMITLQIPVLADTTAEDVLNAIAERVSEAIDEIRQQQDGQETEPEIRASVSQETFEPYTDLTRSDLLETMGYRGNG